MIQVHGHFRRSRLILAATVVFTMACKKSPAPSTDPSSVGSPQLPMPPTHSASPAPSSTPRDPGLEEALDKRYGADTAMKDEMRSTMNALSAQHDAEIKLAEINRRRMVSPAPANFVPEPVARKIRLALFVEKTRIKPGERLRFRLELTNVGREPIEYNELESSIFRGGSLGHSSRTISFYVTNPQKKRVKLLSPIFPDDIPLADDTIYPPDGMTEAQKQKWMDETNAMGRAASTFQVKILPGETLRSLGDDNSEREPYRILASDPGFKIPGTYRLQVELDDRPKPMSNRYIEINLRTGSTLEEIHKWQEEATRDALGPVSSNAVTIEVSR